MANTKLENELNLDQWALYIRREDALKWGVWGLIGGLIGAVIVNLIARLGPLLTWWPRLGWSIGLPALGALGGVLMAYVRPRKPIEVARIGDQRLNLRARMATALEIDAGRIPTSADIAARQRADAIRAVQAADPKAAFRLVFPRRPALIAAILLALLVVGFIVPNPQEAVIAQKRAEQTVIEKQIERLEQLKKEIEANPNLSPESKETLIKEIDQTIQDLEQGKLSREEAVARLSQTEETLKALLDPNTSAEQAALAEAGRQAAQSEATQPIGKALEQGNYQQAAQEMEALGRSLSEMSPEELTALAGRLEAMAAAVEATDPELAQALRDAAAALRRGDVAAAQQAFRRVAELTGQAGQKIAAQQATQQALGQIQEGRREIAQTGGENQMGGTQGQGNQGSAQGNQGGAQGNQGGTQGNGQGADGAGQGTGGGSGHGDSNQDGGQGTPQVSDGPAMPNSPGDPGEKPYDPIYAPERLGKGDGGELVTVPGNEDEQGQPVGEVTGDPQAGQALVPYDQVYTDYQAQAASALENSYIPRGMKDYVREYFSAIEPRK